MFEVIPQAKAFTEGRLPDFLKRPDLVLAMKQIYKDAATAEQVWQREVKEQLALADTLLADAKAAEDNADALSTLALTLDGFKEGPDESGKCLVRIIMFRARESRVRRGCRLLRPSAEAPLCLVLRALHYHSPSILRLQPRRFPLRTRIDQLASWTCCPRTRYAWSWRG